MSGEVYFERIKQGLVASLGAARPTPAGLRFGDVTLEYECNGHMMIIFLSTLNWMRYASWDGALHINMLTDDVHVAISGVEKLVAIGRRRVGRAAS